ncbi:MAG: HAMP domain-containing histidine kinase [Gammaproteobacteria bacterium]|nr:HAMP domain-containing histidine kinase [Gammaproteobacteria bacterium]
MPESANYFHLNRLFVLRNLAVAGQFIAVFITQYALNIQLPLIAISLIILQVTLFNGFVWIRLGQSKPVTENEVFIHLAFDVLALALLLYFTGGATNPFVMLFLFPLTITVTILPVRYAWLLVVMTVICYSLLMFNYQPLPMTHDMAGMDHSMHGQSVDSEYNLHLMGMWMAFILNACLITYYVYGMGSTLRHQQKQLANAREQSIRDEQLVVLGTLAASTAHELGTPLGTMSLLVSEIEAELTSDNDQVYKDLSNLKAQIGRCKSSLSDLSASVGTSSDLYGGTVQSAGAYFEKLNDEILTIRPESKIHYDWDSLDKRSYIFSDRTLSLALINIIENAIDVSPDFVKWILKSDNDHITLEVLDQGPGLSEKALEMIGQQPYSEKELGLGLGLYLAYAAIRHKGGLISHNNRRSIGSRTIIILPLDKQSSDD